VNEDPVLGRAVLLSAAARVLAVEQLPAVQAADPTDPSQATTDGPGFRLELDLPDRDGRLLLSFGFGVSVGMLGPVGGGDPAVAAAEAAYAQQRDDLALLAEWRDLAVELGAYELPGWSAHIPVAEPRNATIRWSASHWVLRLVDPLHRSVDLPSRQRLDELLPVWRNEP